MLHALKQFIESEKLFSIQEDRVLLAISGGIDSVCLAHLFSEIGVSFAMAHVNFKLRGKESEEDEHFVRALATKLNVALYVTTFDTQHFADQHKISIQMAARELRYNWFEEIRVKNGFDWIATAHQSNDVTETILLNLVRGTGISGLHGISAKKGHIIRPLLFAEREKIDQYIKENKFDFREDSSNESLKYLRNKIRHEVVPVLKEINPDLFSGMFQTAKRLRETEMIQEQVIHEVRQVVQKQQGDDFYFELEKIKRLKPRALFLYELLKPFQFKENVIEDMIRSWDQQPGKIFYSENFSLLKDRHHFIVSPIKKESREMLYLQDVEQSALWRNKKIITKKVSAKNFKWVTDKKTACLDFDLLTFPLQVRSWQEGDYFYPLGMKTKKKLSDFFTGEKVSLNHKNEIPLFISGNDIVWVGKYRLDERYKISPSTKSVYIIELRD